MATLFKEKALVGDLPEGITQYEVSSTERYEVRKNCNKISITLLHCPLITGTRKQVIKHVKKIFGITDELYIMTASFANNRSLKMVFYEKTKRLQFLT